MPKRKGFLDLIDTAINSGIIAKDTQGFINKIRLIRNEAIYGEKQIDEASAKQVLEYTQNILGHITKETETLQIKSALDFAYVVREAIYDAAFIFWEVNPKFPQGEYDFKVKDTKRKEYIINAKYRSSTRGLYLSSEEITNCINEAEKYSVPFIIASNLSGLSDKAKKVLDAFNTKYKEVKLSFMFGSNKEEFIQNFRKLSI